MRIWRPISGSEVLAAIRRLVVPLLLAMTCAHSPAFAQGVSPTVRVTTFVLAPFVIEEDGRLGGFSVELWNEIAARLRLQSIYQKTPDVKALFQSLRAERLQTTDATAREPYFPGVFRAMYWAATTLMSQGDQAPRYWLARALAVLWMFVGIIFIASYTAQLTTTLTVQHIRGAINGPNDLPDKQVATLTGSSAVAYLEQHGVVVREFAQNRNVFQALLDGDADAVVEGSAGLDYYATHGGKDRVKMVGPEFNPNDVGFVFPVDSPLRRRVDGALLAMREDGTYQRIYDRWFGTQ